MLGLFICAVFIAWMFATVWGVFGLFLWREGWKKRRYMEMILSVFCVSIDLVVFAFVIRTAYHLFMLP